METNVFDAITRGFACSTARRTLFRLALIPLFAPVAAGRTDEMVARNRRTKKRKKHSKPVFNAFGCVNIGERCTREDQCCSGICAGAEGQRVCVAHGTGICTVHANMCNTEGEAFCGVTNKNCACVMTTGNAPFCGDHTGFPESTRCRDCLQDADCQAEFGPGAACAVFTDLCNALCPGTGRACVLPCRGSAA